MQVTRLFVKGMGSKVVTIQEIASRLGIAVSTVSKGLNGASDISENLRQLVLDTAVEMGYTTKKMRKAEHKKLALFIENMEYDSDNQFGYEIILGFKQASIHDSWDIRVIPINPTMQTEVRYDTYMLKHGFTGAFFAGFALHDEWLKQLQTTNIPTVLLDNYIKKNPNVGYIGTDNYEGIDIAIDLLTKMGHKKIALLNGSEGSLVSEERMDAFLKSMATHGLKPDPRLMAYGYYVAECAQYHVPDFLAAGATAILCGSDLIASGAITECNLRGFHIPRDISIIGFDDLPISAHISPPLTTIRQDRIELGKSAYYTLQSLIKHVSISKTLLRAQLVERQSVSICNPQFSKFIPYSIESDTI